MSDCCCMEQYILPAPRGSEGYVELTRTKGYHGQHWRKHILNLGTLIHPETGKTLTLDDSWFDRVSANFDGQVADIVQFPVADEKNRHTEDPLRNGGEVLGISRDGDKVYVDIDVRNPDVQRGLKDKTILGASALLHMDYKDSSTQDKVGPTLLHVCATNRPYVTGLEDYQEVIAATAADMTDEFIVLAEQEAAVPTKEELIALLKEEHGVDVEAALAAASAKQDTTELTAAIVAALKDTGTTVPLTAGTGDGTSLTQGDLVGAVVELAQSNKAQGEEISKLQRRDAEREVDGYVGEGRVMPKQKARFVELALTNRAMFDDLLPEQPVVHLNHQSGVTPPQGEGKQQSEIEADIAALTAAHSEFFTPNGRKATA